MPSKKKKYNARFPAGRIKKIMQTDEEIGKVAQAVPIIISRTLELFVHSLLLKTMQITNAKQAKTLSPSHMKQCILSESRFDFLKDLVKAIPDVSGGDDEVSTPPLTGIINLSTGSAVHVPEIRYKTELNVRNPSDNIKSNIKDCVQSNHTDINLKCEASNSNNPPNIQITVPSTFCGQPNFYTEVNPINLSTQSNNGNNNQPRKPSTISFTYQVDEDYDT